MPKRILSLLLVVLPFSARASIDDIRANFIAYYTAAGTPRTSARLTNALQELESQARQSSFWL